MQNERKFQTLLNIPKKRIKEYNLTDRKAERNIKYIKKFQKKKLINFNYKYYNGYQHNESKYKNIHQYFSPRISESDNNKSRPENLIKVNQKLKNEKKLKKKSKQHSMINLHYTQINDYNEMNSTTRNKNYVQKNIYNLNIKANNHHNNSTSLIKDYNYSTIESSNHIQKKVNIEEMIERVQKGINKKKIWIENQKKKKEEEEKKLCSYAPKMDKNSKKINLKIKENFLERQKIKIEQKKKRKRY